MSESKEIKQNIGKLYDVFFHEQMISNENRKAIMKEINSLQKKLEKIERLESQGIDIVDFGKVSKLSEIPKPFGAVIHIGYSISKNIIRMYQKTPTKYLKGTILEKVFATHNVTTVNKTDYTLPAFFEEFLTTICNALTKKNISFSIKKQEVSD